MVCYSLYLRYLYCCKNDAYVHIIFETNLNEGQDLIEDGVLRITNQFTSMYLLSSYFNRFFTPLLCFHCLKVTIYHIVREERRRKEDLWTGVFLS